MRQFLDIVRQAEQLPLPVHLLSAPQGEPIQPLVASEVAEGRFHRCKTPGDHFSPDIAVDSPLHPLGVAFSSGNFAEEEGDLPGRRLVQRCRVRSHIPTKRWNVRPDPELAELAELAELVC